MTLMKTSGQFHLLLAEASANPMFVVILNTLYAHPVNVRIFSPITRNTAAGQMTIVDHEKILEAIRTHDAAGARSLMYEHTLWLYQLVRENANATIPGSDADSTVQENTSSFCGVTMVYQRQNKRRTPQ
jgi:DNA-binding FadR family transcriptional regulator